MKLFKTLAALTAIISLSALSAPSVSAQTESGTMTPYSRYGYGMLRDNCNAAQRAMGGVGYAMSSGRTINVMNPASYAAVDSLTFLFDMALDFTILNSEENGAKEKEFGGGLDYVTMLFPVHRTMGVSLGLLPFSGVGYAFGSDIENGKSSHTGTGNINKLYVGWGINPVKGLSAGFNFSYLFGNIVNDTYASAITGSTSLFERTMEVRDWHLDLGVQYTYDISPRHRASIGLTYSPAKNLHGRTYGIYYDTDFNTPDTVPGDHSMKGRFSLPATYGVGINYQWGGRLMAEADFTYQPWKSAKYNPGETFERTELSNRWKAAFGAQYIPNPRGGYFSRVQYRAGFYYNQDYLVIKGNNLREYGLSVGCGLPVPSFKSIVNVGIEYKHRQASPQALIKENYFNFTLGVNFNEMWFYRNKIR